MTGSVALETPPDAAPATRRPRVLFVGATRYDLPLPTGLARKWDALEDRLALRVVARAGSVSAPDDRFRLVDAPGRPRGGAAFYASLARVVAAETKEFRPDVVVCQSPYEACSCLVAWRLRRRRPKLIVELHADWRTATRLYGSRLRRALAIPSDRAALFAIRRADATRALSPWTARIAEEATGRPPVASFTDVLRPGELHRAAHPSAPRAARDRLDRRSSALQGPTDARPGLARRRAGGTRGDPDRRRQAARSSG